MTFFMRKDRRGWKQIIVEKSREEIYIQGLTGEVLGSDESKPSWLEPYLARTEGFSAWLVFFSIQPEIENWPKISQKLDFGFFI